MSLFNLRRRFLSMKPMLPRPRAPPIRFDIIGVAQKVEEETLVWNTPEECYPVRIGETFKARYRVVGKLGCGAYATAWLCKDIWYLVPPLAGHSKCSSNLWLR